MERKHLKQINAGRKPRRKMGRATASCEWLSFTYGKAVETPTMKAEAGKQADKRKVA